MKLTDHLNLVLYVTVGFGSHAMRCANFCAFNSQPDSGACGSKSGEAYAGGAVFTLLCLIRGRIYRLSNRRLMLIVKLSEVSGKVSFSLLLKGAI